MSVISSRLQITEEAIAQLADKYAERLRIASKQRVVEMQNDDLAHHLIYRALGVNEQEGHLIDVYQNKGRFLYRYAGAFLEEATKLCFREAFRDAETLRIPNTRGQRPKTFEIDCLVGNHAIEIKWRDATTDGDHITKEHTRLQVIADAGYMPIRIMFYYPNRLQAMRIQQTLAALYAGMGGAYYHGDAAWNYVLVETGIDLRRVIENIANHREVAPL